MQDAAVATPSETGDAEGSVTPACVENDDLEAVGAHTSHSWKTCTSSEILMQTVNSE